MYAKNQFQSVTGTSANGNQASQAFLTGPQGKRLESIEGAATLLAGISKEQKNFTAASSAAYGAGTNIGYRDQMLAKGGTVVGGTVFQTGAPNGSALAGPSTPYQSQVASAQPSLPVSTANTPASQAPIGGGTDNAILVAQLGKLDEMISIMKNQLGVQSKQLQMTS